MSREGPTSELVKGQLPCEDCGSSDALALYSDGHTHCFSCETTKHPRKGKENMQLPETTPEKPNTPVKTQGSYRDLSDRKINKKTCEFYDVRTQVKAGTQEIARVVFPYANKNGQIVAQKIRMPGKTFAWEGDKGQSLLFGQHKFPAGCSRKITITEGELDALAVYQMTGSRWPVVSISDGAGGAKRNLRNKDIYEYLDSFEEIYVAFDMDEVGQKAAKDFAEILPPRKVKIIKMRHKDACEYLQKESSVEDATQAWNHDYFNRAEPYKPDGVVGFSSLKKDIMDPAPVKSVPYAWAGLNKLVYGARTSELVVIIADTGVGKTAICREMAYHLYQTTTSNIAMFMLEEQPRETALGLMSIYLNKPLHLPDTQYTQEEKEQAFEKFAKEDRFQFFDSFAEDDYEAIERKIRYFAKAHDCKYMVVDHISIMVSGQQHGDERKALDEISTRLKKLTIELDIHIILVAHINREGQIRGSGNIEKVANILLRATRDKLNTDPKIRNTTLLTVEKNRFSGRTGPAATLEFNPYTYRLEEGDEGEVETYLEKVNRKSIEGSVTGFEEPVPELEFKED